MLKNLNIKKEYLLLGGSLLFLLICYRFSFSHTVEAWKLHRELTQKVASSNDLAYQPGYLERKNSNLDHIIARFKADTTSLRSNIITSIALQAEKLQVKLSGVPVQDVTSPADKYIVQRLDFEGDYFSLVKLLNQLQTVNGIGLVRSADFKKGKSMGGKEEPGQLGMRLYIVTSK